MLFGCQYALNELQGVIEREGFNVKLADRTEREANLCQDNNFVLIYCTVCQVSAEHLLNAAKIKTAWHKLPSVDV